MWQCARRTNVLLLGCDRPRIGWLMESYNWMWERPLLRMFHTFLLARNTTPVQMWERPERDAFGAALRPNETGREPFVSGFPDGVACRTFLAIEQTYLKCALLSRRTFQIAAVSTRRALRSCEMHGT